MITKQLLRFKFWISRKLNDNFPSNKEVLHTTMTCDREKFKNLSPTVRLSMSYYAVGFSLEYTALKMELTRERVRQLILKGMRVIKSS